MNMNTLNSNLRRVSTLLLLAPLLLLASCTETPLAPDLGDGSTLTALIDGIAYQFDIESSATNYNVGTLDGRVSGSSTTLPVTSIIISFRGVDLDNDTFPRTLSGNEVGMTVVTGNDQGDSFSYNNPPLSSQSNATITITATDGTTVDGTFSGTLVEEDDPNDKIVVSGGVFSAKLSRE